MNGEILALSAALPLPIPVGRDEKVHAERLKEEKENGVLFGQSPPRPAGSSPRSQPIAPYQALPITASVITEHITPALPVIDHTRMSQEVSLVQDQTREGVEKAHVEKYSRQVQQ